MTENLRLIPMLLALAASPLAHARLHSNDVASDAVKSPLRNALAEGFAKQETSFDLALKLSGHAANTGFHAPWAIDAMLPHFALRSGAENPGLKDANGESSIPYALAENESVWATDYLADADERHELRGAQWRDFASDCGDLAGGSPQAVPEPSTIGLASLGLGAWLKRKKISPPLLSMGATHRWRAKTIPNRGQE